MGDWFIANSSSRSTKITVTTDSKTRILQWQDFGGLQVQYLRVQEATGTGTGDHNDRTLNRRLRLNLPQILQGWTLGPQQWWWDSPLWMPDTISVEHEWIYRADRRIGASPTQVHSPCHGISGLGYFALNSLEGVELIIYLCCLLQNRYLEFA